MKPETKFRTSQVEPFLDGLPFTYHLSIQQRAIAGDPDKIVCIRGYFVALELKKLGGKASKLQLHKLDLLRKAGGISIVVSPANWEEVKRKLFQLAQTGENPWLK